MHRILTLGLAISLVALSPSCSAKASDGEAKEETAKAPAYELSVVANPEAVAKDNEASYRITITPKGEYVLKTETPFKATLSAGETVALAKNKFTSKDFEDPESKAKSVTTTFKASAAGDAKINADLAFFLCTAQLCERFTAKNELPITVQ